MVNDSSLISGNDASKPLQINSAVEWNCLETTSTINILFFETLSLAAGCHLSIENGQAEGEVAVPNDSSFTIISSLAVSVLDRGLPVSGAIIEFKGTDYYTDSFGEVTIQSTACGRLCWRCTW